LKAIIFGGKVRMEILKETPVMVFARALEDGLVPDGYGALSLMVKNQVYAFHRCCFESRIEEAV